MNLYNQKIIRLDGTEIEPDYLSNIIQRLIDKFSVLGLSVTIFNNHQIVYKRAFGFRRNNSNLFLKTETVFYGASLSKPVFSILVLKLIEEGILELDRPLLGYLPEKALKKSKYWWQDFSQLANNLWMSEITPRMCLSHTSGMPNWRWHEKDNILNIKFKPGSRYSYSGEGFCYLQYVIEYLTNCPLEILTREKIFNQLQMNHTYFKWQDRFASTYCFGHDGKGAFYDCAGKIEARAASTLYTTPDDYSLFLSSVLGRQLLSFSLSNEMFRPQIQIRSKAQFGEDAASHTRQYDSIQLSYALGWGVFKTPYGMAAFKEGHGNGFAHYTILFPELGTAVLLMSNDFNSENIYNLLLENTIGDTYSPLKWQVKSAS